MTVDGQARLVVRPRQVVVLAAVKHGVGRLGGRYTRHQELVQFVAVVADAHLELDWSVHGADHRCVDERRVESELATTQKFLTTATRQQTKARFTPSYTVLHTKTKFTDKVVSIFGPLFISQTIRNTLSAIF